MTLEKQSLEWLKAALARLEEGFEALPPFDGELAPEEAQRAREILLGIAERLKDNYPYAHPLYAGQMLKPPHPLARAAYQLALWVNPNNHALDGGRASSAMERECVAALGELFGMPQALGHLTSGGTLANLEALWVCGREQPARCIVGSELAHYTHPRISAVLGLEYESIPTDDRGRMDVHALRARLERGGVGGLVATLGTTSIGSIDPLDQILPLARRHGVRVHVDAAYGGYFTLASTLSSADRGAFDALPQADSIAIDPHKHGLQPYGCGAVLFRDPLVGRHYRHDSPYTYFSSAQLHLGEITLECSRPGAAAVALRATLEWLPLERGGRLASMLEQCLAAARGLRGILEQAPERWRVLLDPPLDILVYTPRAPTASATTRLSRRIFEEAAREGLHLALTRVEARLAGACWKDLVFDEPTVTCLRSALMKPEHAAWLAPIHERLERAWVRAQGSLDR
jgi:glutamate/tyrosine decarboxylase-like PLP-dependent enzyme